MAPAPSIIGPPGFVGVGTQRSGTTWWFETVLAHPQIRPPRGRRKEQHFFDRFAGRELTDADIAEYHERFPRRRGQIAGEWTPRYMHDFWTPRLLARAAPDAKLLIMFRDPIERFRSGVPHQLSRTPAARLEKVTADAIERSRYATQLRRVLASHDPARILILQYEKCVADPAGQYRRTLRFLGVDPDHVNDAFDRPRGTPQTANKKPLWPTSWPRCARRSNPRSSSSPDWRRRSTSRSGGTSATSPRRMRSPLERPQGRAELGPPDFVGVGAIGSGSAWWLRFLLSHPEIRPPRGRRLSLHHFDRFCAREMTDADVVSYHAHFPRRAGTICGEWTARYMLDAWTPLLLKRAAPDARLLVLLSDPIERYRTIFTERRAKRAGEATIPMADVVDRQRHAAQLTLLHRFYDRGRILVLQYERCRRDPLVQYRRTLDFLGVRDREFAPRRMRRAAAGEPQAPRFEPLLRLGLPQGMKRRVSERQTGRSAGHAPARLWPDLEAALHTALDPDVLRLRELVADLDLSLWPNFAHLAAPAEPVPA